MSTAISASWLLAGHFNFSKQNPRNTTSQEIRNELSAALGRDFRPRSFPAGPTWKHTLWWREGDADYAEAQFYAAIAPTYPMLSLGVSIEKGRELRQTKKPPMNRLTWDWQRLVQHAGEVFSIDVPEAAAALQAPINVRIRSRPLDPDSAQWEYRVYSFVNGSWYTRHVGQGRTNEMVEYIRKLDGQTDSWVYLEFARDLGPSEADGLSPAAVARVLLAFRRLRDRIRC
jgi:hypothetical protein